MASVEERRRFHSTALLSTHALFGTHSGRRTDRYSVAGDSWVLDLLPMSISIYFFALVGPECVSMLFPLVTGAYW